MAVVIGTNLRKELSAGVLFDGVSFKVERRERLALSGANGAGKTTLLRILAGETRADGGQLVFDKGTRVALHDQRPPLALGVSLREYALAGARDLVELEEELRRLEAAMAGGEHGEETLRRYSEAQARLEHAGGYAWRERSLAALRGLGFADDELDRRLDTFSGGELTRASLARALAGDPDLLLLDEPTNHLDVERLEWLERTLVGLDAAVILVAHDRWFLEATTTAVLELEAGRSTYFPGQWHRWRHEKAARMLNATKSIERYDADIARLQRFVDRFRYKKTKAKQAQAKLTHIGRLKEERARSAEQVALLSRRSKRLGFEFLRPPRSGRVVVEAEALSVAAGEKELLAGVSFAVERGEHVGLVGPNGSGKTTLLETILGRHEAAAGAARLGHGVVAAYFSQHEAELDGRGSVLECVQSMTGLRRPEAQNLLGRFLFSGWEAHEKAVAVLSGGERRRLALAVVVASGANFLVLDEPTNHLDLESREALEAALEAFPATVLLVSHDRALLDAVAERTLAIEDGHLRSYDGGWADYVRTSELWTRSRTLDAAPVSETGLKTSRGKPRPEATRPKRPSALERVEAEIAAKEEAVAVLERRLADDWGNVELLTEHRSARDELQRLLERWETLFEQAQA
ncbi:MAG TPA: ABC-F family ATP-binding cassette domain-containing protein [Gaiellaceae bacterium]|nr:ABC-F family ATP-binding cassette domain-containing protein [Gaiellaceae bacterium]